MTKIYFANGLFSEADFRYNAWLVEQIRKNDPAVELYLPQENGAINDKSAYANSIDIAKGDTDELVSSDLMVAILDGVSLDAGVAAEIGVAFAKGIPVLGLYTDSRQQGADNHKKLAALQEVAESQFSYINLYVVGLIKQNGAIYSTSAELLAGVHEKLNAKQKTNRNKIITAKKERNFSLLLTLVCLFSIFLSYVSIL